MRPPCMLSNIFVRVPGLQAPINVVFILALFWLFGMEACFLHRTSKRMAAFCFVERTVKRRRICNERRFLFTVRYRGASRSHAKAQGSFFYSHFSIVYRFKRKGQWKDCECEKCFFESLSRSFSRIRKPQTAMGSPFPGGWGNDSGIDYQTMEETFFPMDCNASSTTIDLAGAATPVSAAEMMEEAEIF